MANFEKVKFQSNKVEGKQLYKVYYTIENEYEYQNLVFIKTKSSRQIVY